MAKIKNLKEEFLKAMFKIDKDLLLELFKKHSFSDEGLACFIEYRKENSTRVEFLFGPSNWNIEMIIYTSKGKFAFKDLLSIPEIENWVSDNRYKQKNGRNLEKELEWFVSLLKVSLLYIE
jgi:hypothetical protein